MSGRLKQKDTKGPNDIYSDSVTTIIRIGKLKESRHHK